MPPRLTLLPSIKTIPYRPKPPIPRWHTAQLSPARLYSSSKTLPISDSKKGPNTDQLPHASEEAAAVSKIKGETGPDLDQGTPVQEVVKGDDAAQEKLPKVMKEQAAAAGKSKAAAASAGKRSFCTSAVRRDEYEYVPLSRQQQLADGAIVGRGTMEMEAPSGLKFDPVVLPLAPEDTLRRRYDPVVEQFTGLIMQHGKKSVAQRNVAVILSHLRSSPPPRLRADRPLVAGHPPPSHLPLHPIMYMTLAIDSIAPIIRIRTERGAAGGGASVQIPVPLHIRQRRRTAMMWIIDSVSKRKVVAGKGGFAIRLAEEMIAIVEGRSALWEKRVALHKQGVMGRVNVNFRRRR